MFRKYGICTTRQEGKITRYFISDALNDAEIDERPMIATFPISQAYPSDMQKARAYDYCDYLNKLVEAAESAYNNNQLVNILKA